MTDQPPPNTDLTDVERARRRLTELEAQAATTWGLDADEIEEIDALKAFIAAMSQQPVHADEDELGDGSDFGVTGEWWGLTDVERLYDRWSTAWMREHAHVRLQPKLAFTAGYRAAIAAMQQEERK